MVVFTRVIAPILMRSRREKGEGRGKRRRRRRRTNRILFAVGVATNGVVALVAAAEVAQEVALAHLTGLDRVVNGGVAGCEVVVVAVAPSCPQQVVVGGGGGGGGRCCCAGSAVPLLRAQL